MQKVQVNFFLKKLDYYSLLSYIQIIRYIYIYIGNSSIGEPLGEERGVVALMPDRKVLLFYRPKIIR